MKTAAVAVAALACVVVAGAASGQTASRVIDRTLSCRAIGVGMPDPVRTVRVTASGRRGEWSPEVVVLHGNGYGETGWGVGARVGSNPQRATGGVYTARVLCEPAAVRLALSPGRLEGGRTRLAEVWSCDVPVRVLVRVRAVFRRPVQLGVNPRFRGERVADGAVIEAQLAVATPQRREIAFGAVCSSRTTASIFVDPARCFVQ